MKNSKKIISLLLPPLFFLIYRKIKKLISPKSRTNKEFSGVYNDVSEILDENPWDQKQWFDLSKRKLSAAQTHFSGENNSTSESKSYEDYLEPLLLITNLISQCNPCKILDLGGGTGICYFLIYPYLSNPENVKYHVVDNNIKITELSTQYFDSKKISYFLIQYQKTIKLMQKLYSLIRLYSTCTIITQY